MPLQNAFPTILRVKNLFVDPSDKGLRFILVNVPLESKSTFADMLASGGFDAAVASAKRANPGIGAEFDNAAALLRLMAADGDDNDDDNDNDNDNDNDGAPHGGPARVAGRGGGGACRRFGTQRITMVVELQLHLDFYLQARKKTHLWFKIARATDMEALKGDCAPYFHALE